MIQNLILSGGSTKCIVFVGAIQSLIKLNILDNITNIAGTSGGSLLATLLVLDYSIDEIKELYIKINLNDLIDINSNTILNFFNDYGLDKGDKFIQLIQIVIKKKTNNGSITFKELYEQTHKNLIITGTCVEKERVEYFNYINTPDMPVYLAIRISISLPFIFNRIIYNDFTYIDGGFIEYFPIQYFDNISESLALGIENTSLENIKLINSIEEYIYKLVCGLYRANQNNLLNICKDNTIIYKTSIHGLANLDVPTKNKIINYGYNHTNNYFSDILIKQTLELIIQSIIDNN